MGGDLVTGVRERINHYQGQTQAGLVQEFICANAVSSLPTLSAGRGFAVHQAEVSSIQPAPIT